LGSALTSVTFDNLVVMPLLFLQAYITRNVEAQVLLASSMASQSDDTKDSDPITGYTSLNLYVLNRAQLPIYLPASDY